MKICSRDFMKMKPRDIMKVAFIDAIMLTPRDLNKIYSKDIRT